MSAVRASFRFRGALAAVAWGGLLLGCSSSDAAATDPGGCPASARGTDEAPEDVALNAPASCAFSCGACAEATTPYDCPSMHAWSETPHAEACGCWDGSQPTVAAGACTVSAPTGTAARKAGPLEGGGYVLPDGHAAIPAGTYVPLAESDLEGTFPMSLVPIPGTALALSSDGGIKDDALRLLDLDVLAAKGDPSVSHVRFARPSALFHGVAWLPPGGALASGGGDGMLYAFDVDTAQKTVARATARDIDLGPSAGSASGVARWYAGPLAVTADASRVLVGPSTADREIQVRSLAQGTWGQSLGSIPIAATSVFEIVADPFDPAGTTFYATAWDGDALLEIDAATLAVTRTLPLGKNPEGIAFLSASIVAVASSDDDAITLVDRTTWAAKATIDLRDKGDPSGLGPSALFFDAARSRLYATLSGVNAVAAFDVSGTGADVTIAPAGRVGTAWWPTAVAARDDGSLVILSGKGYGTGPDAKYYAPGDGPITSLMHGGVQHVPFPTAADLDGFTKIAEANRKLADADGYPKVTCPAGADDFPVPTASGSGPSRQIKHVVLIVRENKTYDAAFGDLPGTDGDATLVMAPGHMEEVWGNGRALARTFSHFDNFYTDAEQSLQGHVWTAFGRTTDFVERTWLTAWGRATRAPTAGIAPQGKPTEGSIFDVLDRAAVPYEDMGEIVGTGKQPLDGHYPGLVTAIGKPDVQKACYIAGRARVLCDLPAFTYVVMPNDHTYGGQANAPNPGVMIAVNDEATGRVVDAISHSPLWKDSLVIVTEDDPQDGGDHVDVHRTMLFMASPWVRRGYVSHGHYDMSSVHKLVYAVLGVPFPNELVEEAALPLDVFTSTPDYTPFAFTPRTYDKPCNPVGTKAAAAASGWSFDEVDEQPGLSGWVRRIVHDGQFE